MTDQSKVIQSSLNCECGFFTSDAAYMLLHLKESSDCKWSDGQRTLVRQKMLQIDARIIATSETLTLLKIEYEYLEKIFQHKPETKRQPRRCVICHKPTLDMFAGLPQCTKHVTQKVAKDDVRMTWSHESRQRIAGILEDLIGGDS